MFVSHSMLLFLQECSNIFSKGGGEELAELTGSVFLGETHHVCNVSLQPQEDTTHSEHIFNSLPVQMVAGLNETLKSFL